MMSGTFVISLDFELIWGVRDKRSIEEYGENILGARKAIPQILDLFKKYEIHCTWATVGYLFAKEKKELVSILPAQKPQYNNTKLSTYSYFDEVLMDEDSDPYHYADSIIELIKEYPDQEIGSHTFSHYYCLEDGQSMLEFENDLVSAISIANNHNIKLKSIVFPRNQVNHDYLIVLEKLGFDCYRGNPDDFTYKTNIHPKLGLLQRVFRLLDSYINLFGHHSFRLDKINRNRTTPLVNIPSSRF